MIAVARATQLEQLSSAIVSRAIAWDYVREAIAERCRAGAAAVGEH